MEHKCSLALSLVFECHFVDPALANKRQGDVFSSPIHVHCFSIPVRYLWYLFVMNAELSLRVPYSAVTSFDCLRLGVGNILLVPVQKFNKFPANPSSNKIRHTFPIQPKRLICPFGFAPHSGQTLSVVRIGVPQSVHFIIPIFVSFLQARILLDLN